MNRSSCVNRHKYHIKHTKNCDKLSKNEWLEEERNWGCEFNFFKNFKKVEHNFQGVKIHAVRNNVQCFSLNLNQSNEVWMPKKLEIQHLPSCFLYVCFNTIPLSYAIISGTL